MKQHLRRNYALIFAKNTSLMGQAVLNTPRPTPHWTWAPTHHPTPMPTPPRSCTAKSSFRDNPGSAADFHADQYFSNATAAHGWVFHPALNATPTEIVDALCNVYCNADDFYNMTSGEALAGSVVCPASHCYCHYLTQAPSSAPTPVGGIQNPTPEPTKAPTKAGASLPPTAAPTEENVYEHLYNHSANHTPYACCTDVTEAHCLSCRNNVPARYVCIKHPELHGCSDTHVSCGAYGTTCTTYCGTAEQVYKADAAYSTLSHECICVEGSSFVKSCIKIEHVMSPLPSWVAYLNDEERAAYEEANPTAPPTPVPGTCYHDGHNYQSGEARSNVVTRYHSDIAVGTACVSQQRTRWSICTDGVWGAYGAWDGSYEHISCTSV
jgi:hypothetical protein